MDLHNMAIDIQTPIKRMPYVMCLIEANGTHLSYLPLQIGTFPACLCFVTVSTIRLLVVLL
jgi:hypothetical protein